MNITRKEFIAASVAFAVSPMLSAAGRAVKTPLMFRQNVNRTEAEWVRFLVSRGPVPVDGT